MHTTKCLLGSKKLKTSFDTSLKLQQSAVSATNQADTNPRIVYMHCRAGPKVVGHLGSYEETKSKSSNPIMALRSIPVEQHTLEAS